MALNFRENKHEFSSQSIDVNKLKIPHDSIKIDNSDTYYTSIPLLKGNNSISEYQFFKYAPQILIEEIILGYKFKENELSKYQNDFRSIIQVVNGLDIQPDNIILQN
ncbi:MAG TPA: hypothetical protein VLB84_00780 [Bacteroidia bacterium]|nr:hypothetical protein [Bacteroidia bacterium]